MSCPRVGRSWGYGVPPFCYAELSGKGQPLQFPHRWHSGQRLLSVVADDCGVKKGCPGRRLIGLSIQGLERGQQPRGFPCSPAPFQHCCLGGLEQAMKVGSGPDGHHCWERCVSVTVKHAWGQGCPPELALILRGLTGRWERHHLWPAPRQERIPAPRQPSCRGPDPDGRDCAQAACLAGNRGRGVSWGGLGT